MNTIDNKKPPIRPVLRTMELYQTVLFPLDRVITIRATIQYLHDTTEKRFKTLKNKDTKQLQVIRFK